MQAAVPAVHLAVEQVIADDTHVAVHFTVTGTHEGEFMGLPPTGNELSVQAVYIARLEDGKIVEGWKVNDSLSDAAAGCHSRTVIWKLEDAHWKLHRDIWSNRTNANTLRGWGAGLNRCKIYPDRISR